MVEEDGERVKIHYEGYSEKHDEWWDKTDRVEPSAIKPDIYQPFELHRELALQIKLALDSKHRRDLEVRIELRFDRLLFEGGLKQARHLVAGSVRSAMVYGISTYDSLSPLLGAQWHMRGLNQRLNFCYVNLDTVRYHLRKRRAVQEYTPDGEKVLDAGYMIIFKFVRMDGTKEEWDSISKLD